jgi:hypothetical protein
VAAKRRVSSLADPEADAPCALDRQDRSQLGTGRDISGVFRQRIGRGAQGRHIAHQLDRQRPRALGGRDTQQRAAFDIDGAGGLQRRDQRDQAQRQQRHHQNQEHLQTRGDARRIVLA